MSRHGSVLGFGGPFAQHDVGGHVALRSVAGAFARLAQGAPGAGESQGAGSGNQDGVVDAEFEEIKDGKDKSGQA